MTTPELASFAAPKGLQGPLLGPRGASSPSGGRAPLTTTRSLRSALAIALALITSQAAFGQEALIRKNLTERLPDLPKIDEVNKTVIPGLYEVRIGTELLYTDERGDHVIQGSIIDTKTRSDLTQARIDKITAIDFAALPLKDAIVWKQGTGARKLVVFADPNCGYCKKFEAEMQQIKNVTFYTFLLPILGADSADKSRNIWCAKDSGVAWRDWMIKGEPAPRAMGNCDVSVLQRNLAMAKKYRVNGTPALVFEDGKRVPGAMAPADVEKQLVIASRGGKS